MKVAYWIVAGLLAAFYLYSGGKKVLQTKDQLRPMMGWVDSVPLWLLRVIGLVELLGMAGLLLPPLTGIAPELALWAALGLAALQVLATGFHVSRREVKDLWLNIVLLVLAALAAWLATTW